MKKHISYPKIQQFRNIITTINRQVSFTGLDANQEPVYDQSIPKPTITFKGSVKLHGTNAGVCYNKEDGFWIQSRQNIITPENDNAGFAFFADSREDSLRELMKEALVNNNFDLQDHTISLFGEWAGKGIQKGVGISELEKAFYIFGVKISKPQDPEFVSHWLSSWGLVRRSEKIFNTQDFTTYSVDVDFNMPQLSQNKFAEITEAVEKECPIAKAFGIENGLGEGVVWVCEYKGEIHRFKVKGDKHSVSKVKTLAPVDVEKLNSINEFVEYAVTENRFDQAVKEVFGSPDDIDVKKLGDLLRWIINDITSEESDTMAKNGLEPKDVNKYLSHKAKEMFFKAYSKL